jgi:hypothetical protein
MVNRRSPLRIYFYDHPIRADNSHLIGNPPNHKPKVYCKVCFYDALVTLKNADTTAFTAGLLGNVRSEKVLKNICELLIQVKLEMIFLELIVHADNI